jgi:hypothetical protein
MSVVRTWSSFAVMVMAHSYLFATTACAQSLVLAHELTWSVSPPAKACITDDACGSKQPTLAMPRGIYGAEERAEDDRAVALATKALNVWKSVPMTDLLAYDRSSTDPSIGLRSAPAAALAVAQDPETAYPSYDLRTRLREQVRKELGGVSPTGLNTLVHGRKKLGVDFRIRFR